MHATSALQRLGKFICPQNTEGVKCSIYDCNDGLYLARLTAEAQHNDHEKDGYKRQMIGYHKIYK